jgi:hypothetical protein
MSNTNTRNYAITDFELDLEFWNNIVKKYDVIYLVGGEELCPTTQKKHWQMFIAFKNKRSLRNVIKEMSPRHIEVANGSAIQNRDYCIKDNNIIYDYGKCPIGKGKSKEGGQRTDLEKVKEAIANGYGMNYIIKAGFGNQAIKYAEKVLTYCENKRNWEMEVFWLYGKTGSGKTKYAMEQVAEDNDYWISGKNLKWWEGYDANKDVIIDEFRKDYCTFHELLRILDRYEYRIEVKGGSRQLLAKRIFITSCYHPMDVYDTREDVGQLLRRIKTIGYFEKSKNVIWNEAWNDKIEKDIELKYNKPTVRECHCDNPPMNCICD